MARVNDLEKILSTKAGLSTTATRQLLTGLSRLIGRTLLEGEHVTLPGLGSFSLSAYQARRVSDLRNPGKTLMIPARSVPNFKPSTELREVLKTAKPPKNELPLASLARPVSIQFVDLASREISKDVLALLSEQVMRRYQIIPFALEDNRLQLGMVDPENHEALELVKKATGKTIEPYLITQDGLAHILDKLGGGSGELAELAGEAQDTLEAVPEKVEDEGDTTENAALEHAPAAKVITQLIKRAVREGASDIHIEPGENGTEIRIRVDGVLRHVATVPRGIQAGLVARIKVLTNLRLDEHRLPQDGRFRSVIDHGEIDFRVSILPTVDGEKVVLRILDKSAGIIPLGKLGLRGSQFDELDDQLHKSHGMILVTGPTGSGKTTTLYAAIDRLRSAKTNITTLEDPVEYRLAGVNQSQTHAEIGYTFAAGLRSILRQDPNVVLVGEIRDTETAQIAVHAALTGHIVLSTLHTNDAAGAIPRLVDMGIEPFLITSSLNAIVAQRLVRQICTKCRYKIEINTKEYPEITDELRTLRSNKDIHKDLAETAKKLTKPDFYAGKGCAACGNTGYKGRIGIYELLPVNESLKPLITTHVDSAKIADAARKAGMISLREDGILKALDGLTTIEEVWRVTKM